VLPHAMLDPPPPCYYRDVIIGMLLSGLTLLQMWVNLHVGTDLSH
jgi:hypothetical protein